MRGGVYIGDAVNWDSSLNRGLVSWWLALPDQQRGNVFRDLCGKNNGQLTNGPLWSGVSHPGGWGSLYIPNAGHTLHPYISTINAAGFSVSWWVKLISISNSMLLCQATTADDDVIIWVTGGGVLRWENHNLTNSPRHWDAPATISTWHHFTIVQADGDAANAVLYKNGSAHAANVASGNAGTGSTGGLRIGSRSDGLSMNGYMNDVRIYSRALSASEAASLYQESLAGHPSTLNWHRPRVYFDMGAAPPAGNRRRRVLICGAAA